MNAVRMTSCSASGGRLAGARRRHVRPDGRAGGGVERVDQPGQRGVPRLAELGRVLDLLQRHDARAEPVDAGDDLRLLPGEVGVVGAAPAGAAVGAGAGVDRDPVALPVGVVGAGAQSRGDVVLAGHREVVLHVERGQADVATDGRGCCVAGRVSLNVATAEPSSVTCCVGWKFHSENRNSRITGWWNVTSGADP